jgi:hypothetical protein
MDGIMSMADDPASELLTRSFLLGTARNPAAVGAAFKRLVGTSSLTELAALALLGQRMRFRKHGPPPVNGAAVAVKDTRAIVPDAIRPLMRRLVGGKEAQDIASLALADVCNRIRLRPHPFDVPRLAAFVQAHGELLGAYASAWAARGEVDDKQPNYFDADAIDESNWTSARPAARAAFIATLRAREPERGRALVEASFAADAAPVRARLLGALACGLSAADLPFLESLAKDRAPSVREEAQRLLKFIPGTAEAEGRLGDLVARTRVSSTGLLRRRKTLTLERPANLEASARQTVDPGRRWAAAEYAGLGLDAMAVAFALPVSEMIAAAADDAALTGLFARQASIERRFDVLAGIVRNHASDAWIDALGTGDVAELTDDATIDQWCAAALAPQLWPSMPAPAELERLYRFLRRPLPLPQARELLQSRAFASIHGSAGPSGMLGFTSLVIGALMPPPLRSELQAAFARLPPEDMSRAILLLDCLALLDPPHATESSP